MTLFKSILDTNLYYFLSNHSRLRKCKVAPFKRIAGLAAVFVIFILLQPKEFLLCQIALPNRGFGI